MCVQRPSRATDERLTVLRSHAVVVGFGVDRADTQTVDESRHDVGADSRRRRRRGHHPDAAKACAALADHRSALNPVPKDRMCAQVYGGPERATVTGTWRGEQVFAALNRTNACETARWDALVPLVPSGGR